MAVRVIWDDNDGTGLALWWRRFGCGLTALCSLLAGLALGRLALKLGLDKGLVCGGDLIQIAGRGDDADRAGWCIADGVCAARCVGKDNHTVQITAIDLRLGNRACNDHGQC